MVHNGIEYGDMQLISEAYDVLKMVGGLSNEELAEAFTDWNKAELESTSSKSPVSSWPKRMTNRARATTFWWIRFSTRRE